MKSIKIKGIIISVIATVSIGMISYASTTYEVDVINTLNTGLINISIHEYEYNNSGELIDYIDNKTVLPGQSVAKIACIKNEANKAWIRAKVDYISDYRISNLSDNLINIDFDGWIRIGDYYYFTQPIESGQDIEWFNGMTIPYEWDSRYSGERFKEIITVEAVQFQNFTPDFKSSDPWFGTVIEICVRDASIIEIGNKKEAFNIVFENGSNGLVKVGDNFFGNLNQLMPGDIVTDTVNIKNKYSKQVEIFFRTECIENNDLLELINIEIRNGTEVIYTGSLDSTELSQGVSLGRYNKWDESDLVYSVHVPSELTNTYALSEASVKWIFSAVLKKTTNSDGGSDKTNKHVISTTVPETIITETSEEETPYDPLYNLDNKNTPRDKMDGNPLSNTGDRNNTNVYLILLLISGIGIVTIVRKRKSQ